jgi:hypothetical protein
MKTRLVRMASNPRDGIAVEIEVDGEPVKVLTDSERDAVGTDPDPRKAEKAVQDELRTSFTDNADEIFVHKNRDGTYAYAVGLEPSEWPEDEVQ